MSACLAGRRAQPKALNHPPSEWNGKLGQEPGVRRAIPHGGCQAAARLDGPSCSVGHVGFMGVFRVERDFWV